MAHSYGDHLKLPSIRSLNFHRTSANIPTSFNAPSSPASPPPSDPATSAFHHPLPSPSISNAPSPSNQTVQLRPHDQQPTIQYAYDHQYQHLPPGRDRRPPDCPERSREEEPVQSEYYSSQPSSHSAAYPYTYPPGYPPTQTIHTSSHPNTSTTTGQIAVQHQTYYESIPSSPYMSPNSRGFANPPPPYQHFPAPPVRSSLPPHFSFSSPTDVRPQSYDSHRGIQPSPMPANPSEQQRRSQDHHAQPSPSPNIRSPLPQQHAVYENTWSISPAANTAPGVASFRPDTIAQEPNQVSLHTGLHNLPSEASQSTITSMGEPLGDELMSTPEDSSASKRGVITTIIEHCNAIYTFASRYASLSAAHPSGFHPSPSFSSPQPRGRHPASGEVEEMERRARRVLELVESIRADASDSPSPIPVGMPDAGRKRTWVQCSTEEQTPPHQTPTDVEHGHITTPQSLPGELDLKDPNARTLAEKDMMTIRSKRSAAAAVAAANINLTSPPAGSDGLTSSVLPPDKVFKKSRKRGRTPLPGKCHSCNIRETPEWRRGPDGARTLCNACGLHYAKLVRKRDKALTASSLQGRDPNVEDTLPIDMEMVRASSQRGSAPGGGYDSYPNTPIAAVPDQIMSSNFNGLEVEEHKPGHSHSPTETNAWDSNPELPLSDRPSSNHPTNRQGTNPDA